MLVSALSTYAWFLFSTVIIRSANGATPPDKLDLLRPSGQVPVNDTVCFGWFDPPDETEYAGLLRTAGILVFAPEIVDQVAIFRINPVAHDFPDDCAHSPGKNTTQCQPIIGPPGTYVAYWNITYIISADPSKANETYCGPGPYSTQSFFLNSTWEMTLDGSPRSQTISPEISTGTFTTEPTGSVRKLGGAEGSLHGWSLRSLVATAGIAGVVMMI